LGKIFDIIKAGNRHRCDLPYNFVVRLTTPLLGIAEWFFLNWTWK